MKEVRKTGNLMIRETGKRSSRDEGIKSKTSMAEGEKKWTAKLGNLQIQKELVRAQNLSSEQQARIHRQAQRLVGKKVRSTEVKIENDMVSFLELECTKLGAQVQKEKSDNLQLRFQVTELRKNIDYLNRKLENVYKDHDHLAKNNDYGLMEKGQLKEELQNIRGALLKRGEEYDYQRNATATKLAALEAEVCELRGRNETCALDIRCVREEKEQVEQQLQQQTRLYQYVRDSFEEKKREWDRLRQEYEALSRDNLEKKGEKITKFQVQTQSLAEKIKEEQSLRKKLVEKNKEIEKDLQRRTETVRELEEQIGTLKKRLNDLSILKSSNNTIMNQKMAQLAEENAKLRKEIDLLQRKKGVLLQENSKPYLFGPEDD